MQAHQEQENWALLQRVAKTQGLGCMGVSDTHLQACEPHLQTWLNQGMHGEMAYMERHGLNRLNADTLFPGAIRIVSLRVPYVPETTLNQPDATTFTEKTLMEIEAHNKPYVSLYARGRDYHKVIRQRLKRFADAVNSEVGGFGFRVAVDSAPTAEVEIARKAGLGWRGKHTLLIHPEEGSLFFLGEVFTNMPLPLSGEFGKNHCGTCTSCITACPTRAIVKPYQVDARLCISYLTIEHDSEIPLELRPLVGTRIYGCDDCQLACPWNKFAKPAQYADFNPRAEFEKPDWFAMMRWTEQEFLRITEGSAIRRIGYKRFRRNLAVAAGNSVGVVGMREALLEMRSSADAFLMEHIDWALSRLD
ncbi:MAG: tRNA epoxyqueuosine(34) reductase QueG [Limnobacter sp.]|jgi:epoxyqueuosine reductase|uniref:tRNA epoxyqueuosine(34) reductase QueG n=1 Tax=unclassified Limnobacter TaxID=2630203 RepID=UPI000C57917C|nr:MULTISPECIES: tRNA epoxyqueuosine(34) reductase QueG [unclassified Limnobacter]MAG81128.1 tRNA epoxyqueuosine(34) reductase QueG [Sutterellaceae bacterium]MBT85675.1 tRNA epoxyqueuosine(34) reductase QueG [Sutterellaceae bacterium]MDZ4051446.1 tRNA epoxyqueuosine(34) reductase QueG [Limnobacter sp.]RZO91676.1 MAG: tRNA epoxyqueuosine(34) reductase QueG [Limnobacter sp.]|tara:strand:- start:4304 stop:5389 length:1086 start_codon:yes stop_codon:yes gene_type:complete